MLISDWSSDVCSSDRVSTRLIISTQPISTNRSPPPKLSPVVSVSKTISRIPILSPRSLREASDQATNLRARLLLRAIGRDHGIGARTLFRVGRLARQDRLESRRRHALPREHTRPLHQRSAEHTSELQSLMRL